MIWADEALVTKCIPKSPHYPQVARDEALSQWCQQKSEAIDQGAASALPLSAWHVSFLGRVAR